jgi:hypothetical protein
MRVKRIAALAALTLPLAAQATDAPPMPFAFMPYPCEK